MTGVDEFTAVIAGSNAGTIEKCVVSGSKLSLGDFDNFGRNRGSNSGTINNCAVINTAFTRTDSEKAVGAIAGNNSGTIKNSFSYAVTATGVKENAFAPIAVNAEKGTVSTAIISLRLSSAKQQELQLQKRNLPPEKLRLILETTAPARFGDRK